MITGRIQKEPSTTEVGQSMELIPLVGAFKPAEEWAKGEGFDPLNIGAARVIASCCGQSLFHSNWSAGESV
jgi:hypothetical protein